MLLSGERVWPCFVGRFLLYGAGGCVPDETPLSAHHPWHPTPRLRLRSVGPTRRLHACARIHTHTLTQTYTHVQRHLHTQTKLFRRGGEGVGIDIISISSFIIFLASQ